MSSGSVRGGMCLSLAPRSSSRATVKTIDAIASVFDSCTETFAAAPVLTKVGKNHFSAFRYALTAQPSLLSLPTGQERKFMSRASGYGKDWARAMALRPPGMAAAVRGGGESFLTKQARLGRAEFPVAQTIHSDLGQGRGERGIQVT